MVKPRCFPGHARRFACSLSGISIATLLVLLATAACHGQTLKHRQTPQDDSVKVCSSMPADQLATFSHKVIPEVISRTEKTWWKLVPEEARPPKNIKGKVTVQFLLRGDGKVSDMSIAKSSGIVALDQAAFDAIANTSFHHVIPHRLSERDTCLQFVFLYNMKPGEDPASSPQPQASQNQ